MHFEFKKGTEYEIIEKMALDGTYSSKLKKLHLQQIESQARHTDSSIA